MSLRGRLEKLEREIQGEIMTLLCPECGEEFICHGDAAVKYIVHEWRREAGEKCYRETPEDILRLFDHEHTLSAFVEKSSGLPFLSKSVSGMDLGSVA